MDLLLNVLTFFTFIQYETLPHTSNPPERTLKIIWFCKCYYLHLWFTSSNIPFTPLVFEIPSIICRVLPVMSLMALSTYLSCLGRKGLLLSQGSWIWERTKCEKIEEGNKLWIWFDLIWRPRDIVHRQPTYSMSRLWEIKSKNNWSMDPCPKWPLGWIRLV